MVGLGVGDVSVVIGCYYCIGEVWVVECDVGIYVGYGYDEVLVREVCCY